MVPWPGCVSRFRAPPFGASAAQKPFVAPVANVDTYYEMQRSHARLSFRLSSLPSSIWLCFLVLFACSQGFGQTPASSDEAAANSKAPTGFNLIDLGQDIDSVKAALEADSNFLFRGDPDVSMLARPNEALIETSGLSYVSRAYFQFHERRLYTIILELDRERIDHFTMYTTFVGRYGDPDYLDPDEMVWDFGEVRLSLERPLRVKYVDVTAFDEILESGRREEALETMKRQRFLDQF